VVGSSWFSGHKEVMRPSFWVRGYYDMERKNNIALQEILTLFLYTTEIASREVTYVKDISPLIHDLESMKVMDMKRKVLFFQGSRS
jgi:hypothetical protein